MGTEYARWLLPKGNVFAPSADGVAKLVERLRKDGWIADPASPDFAKLGFAGDARHAAAVKTGGYAVKSVGPDHGADIRTKLAASFEPLPVNVTRDWLDDPEREELRLVYPVSAADPPLKYPMNRRPAGALYWQLEIHRAPEYVYPIAETIDPIATECRCGDDLAFDWDDDVVPAFGASSGIYAECEACSRTFDPSQASATITNPFDGSTEEVRGGAAYRFALKIDCGKCFVADPALAIAPELVAVVEEVFGRAFYQVGAVE